VSGKPISADRALRETDEMAEYLQESFERIEATSDEIAEGFAHAEFNERRHPAEWERVPAERTREGCDNCSTHEATLSHPVFDGDAMRDEQDLASQ
jgi:hypothetical protein